MTVLIPINSTPAPSRLDTPNFAERADAYHAWLPVAIDAMNAQNLENNAVAADITADIGATTASAAAASASAAAAAASAAAAAASASVAAGEASADVVGFAPAGTISSTNVQAAIEEVSSDLTASITANFTATQNGTVFLLTSVAGTNTITATITPAITAYVTGQTFRFVAAGANTGAVTININGLGAKAVTKSGATALTGGDIPAGAAVQIFYDGTRFQLSSGGGSSSGVNLLTQANGVSVLAGTGQVLVGPLTIPTGQNITVASGARLVLL
jgi:hypothetical protein